MRRILSSSASTLALATFLVAGCAVGPDYSSPPAPTEAVYDGAPTAEETVDGAQHLKMGQDIPAQWWILFHSDGLNRLITQALKDNPDLESATASLHVAQDNLAAAGSELFPTISGSFSGTRQKTSSAANDGLFPGFTYTLYNASVGVTYGIDLFGGTRRAIEGLEAQADQARFEREAAYLTLTSNVVTAAIQEASIREQIASTQAIITDQEKVLKILDARFEAGAVSKASVAQQQASVASARTLLPPLEHQLVVTRHLLSVLVGQMPQNAPEATFSLDTLQLPESVPLSLPSKLVAQRPDIQMAEANLHQASAAIGVAIANRLPQITLSADMGTVANQLGKLFSPGGGAWSFGSSAAETLFDAGALADQEDAARDAYVAAAAQYRKTVLAAFQNVADTLHALQSDAESLNAKTEADKAASESLSLAQAQLQAGAITYADLLVAEQTEQQTKLALVQAKAQRYADTAALFAALGGGWWNRDNEGLIIDNDDRSHSILRGIQ